MLDALDDDQHQALMAILGAPVGWSWCKPPTGKARVAWRAECRADKIAATQTEAWLEGMGDHVAAIPALEALGLAERWPFGDGAEAVTLTPWGANHLGFVLAALRPAEALPQWCRPGDIPDFARQRREAGHAGLDLPELVIDKAPTALELLCYTDGGGSPMEAVKLFGMTVPVVPRLGKKPKGKAGPKRKARHRKRARKKAS